MVGTIVLNLCICSDHALYLYQVLQKCLKGVSLWLRGHDRLTHIKQRGIFRKKKYRYKELQCLFSEQFLMMFMFVQSFVKISRRVSELLKGLDL